MPGRDVTDARARAVQIALEADVHPIGSTAPCMNPECAGPVDYLGTGAPVLYCSRTCRSRASTLSLLAKDELDLVERTLAETKYKTGVPRRELQERAHRLRWWLLRLAPTDER